MKLNEIKLLSLLSILSLSALSQPPVDPWDTQVNQDLKYINEVPGDIIYWEPIILNNPYVFESLPPLTSHPDCWQALGPNCTPSMWTPAYSTVFHPNFPNCPILARYYTLNCINDITYIYFVDFDYFKDDPNCSALDNYINGFGIIERSEKMNVLEGEIFSLISNKLFSETVDDIISQGGTLPTEENSVILELRRGLCQAWCVGQKEDPVNGTIHVYDTYQCDESECCYNIRRYWVDENGDKNFSYYTNSQGIDRVCEDATDPETTDCNLNSNFILVLPSTNTCEIESGLGGGTIE